MLKQKIQQLKRRVADHKTVAPGLEKVFSETLLKSKTPQKVDADKEASLQNCLHMSSAKGNSVTVDMKPKYGRANSRSNQNLPI